MSAVLFLAHRLPFPPNKGDKIRSFHLLEALRQRYEVHVGTFVDSPEDRTHVDTFRRGCASAYVADLNPGLRRVASARALLGGGSLTDAYYAHAGLGRWVHETIERQAIAAIVAFSAATVQFVPPAALARCGVVDFCDIDSDKWRQYAQRRRWPMSVLFGREAAALEREEIAIARQARASLLVTEREAATFRDLAPDVATRVHAIRNGVDAKYFCAHDDVPPATAGRPRVVFTGAMDYWANVEGVCWFAREVWPLVRQAQPEAEFAIVGARPTGEVTALAAEPGVVVTGTVPDIRPWLRTAHVAVAPLRIARGVQNKVLEAMAMERHVVATQRAVAGLDFALPADDVRVVDEPAAFAAAVVQRLAGASPLRSRLNREYVQRHYDWGANLGEFLDIVAQVASAGSDRAAA